MTSATASAVLADVIVKTLNNLKARDVQILEVSSMTSITDFMVIASGTSDRHVKALSQNIIEKVKKIGVSPIGVEGQSEGDWVLVDLGDVIVHVMLPRVREFYSLEKLWSVVEQGRTGGAQGSGS
ncbi:MAG: ribosome silencing factor [Gammaproteobacteria bacterium]